MYVYLRNLVGSQQCYSAIFTHFYALAIAFIFRFTREILNVYLQQQGSFQSRLKLQS